MNFRFQIGKATEAACLFLERGNRQMNSMKLVKLLYLLDRRSLDRRNIPVIGGDYLSMRNGPVTSEILDLLNEGRLYHETDHRWEECISDRADHEVALLRMPEREQVSNAEVKLLDEIWAEHGGKTQWQLVDWCHDHCKEWTPVLSGQSPISVEQIGEALGKAGDEIAWLTREARELNRLNEIFAQG
ncbi:MAG TPA: Panacea domain-containing protein [Verrucomicrobiae bacterium]|nr:Panacea domain-containing protein [Verrucomicrobiae bacterium]